MDACGATFTHSHVQLFYSFFKSLVGKEVIVELKNDLWYVLLLIALASPICSY